jgi:hypothetical protein
MALFGASPSAWPPNECPANSSGMAGHTVCMWSIAAATSSAAQSRMRALKPVSDGGREPPTPR